MADRDIVQAADIAADGLRERLGDELAGWSQHITERLLPVMVAYAAARVDAERERIAAAIWATIPLPGRDTDVEARAYRDAARIAARIARGAP
ncbi:MAG: hypothetical protein ACRD0W_21020 [Acidimicrobiales bacterium]